MSGYHPSGSSEIDALGHVWTAPSWQGLSSRVQAWSGAAMCSAFSAVHMTAGHNALRGSGPGQKLAFDYALAQVGCPDRRIDRLCITCCLPSQPSHHACVVHNAVAGLLDRNVQSSKMVHAALLLLMLEAV